MIDYDEYDSMDETLFNADVAGDKLALIVDGLLRHANVTERSWGVEFTGYGSTTPRYRLFRRWNDLDPAVTGLAVDSVPIEASVESAVTKFASHLEGDSKPINDNFTITDRVWGWDATSIVSGSISAQNLQPFTAVRGGIQYHKVPYNNPLG